MRRGPSPAECSPRPDRGPRGSSLSGVTQSGEKLWGYASLARLWSWTLIVGRRAAAAALDRLQAATDQGLDARWYAAAFGITGLTGVISYPLFRVWLRKTALPSVRLPQAVRATGPRRLEATPRDWRRWALFTGPGADRRRRGDADVPDRRARPGRHGRGRRRRHARRLGRRDARGRRGASARIEATEGRRYYAACRRPTGVGNKLVWLPRRAPRHGGALATAARSEPFSRW